MREFLDRVLPWSVAAEGVFFNVHWNFDAPDISKKLWTGRACSTIDELINACMFGGRGKHDVYVCMSAQSQHETKTSKKGHTYLKAVRSQENVVALRTLYVDVDVKPETYPTRQDAALALREFLTKSGMPMPTLIVSSGSGGFHCHWCLDQELSRARWQPLAQALLNACRAHDFKVDGVCTIDSARILRVPGTTNWKTEEGRPVTMGKPLPYDYTLESIKDVLAPYASIDVPSVDIQLPTKVPSSSVNHELTAGIKYEAPPVDLTQVATQCAFLRDTLATGGAHNNEPLWRDSLICALFTEDPKGVAHLLSAGHPGYDPADTDAKLDLLLQQKALKDFGYVSCQAISNHGCTSCATCPHFAAGKSPLNLGIPIPHMPAQVVAELPDGYLRDDQGLVFFLEPVDDKGLMRQVLVCPYPVFDAWLQKDPWILNFTTVTDTGQRRQIHLPTEMVNTREGIGKALGRQGMALHDLSQKQLKAFLVAYINKLQRQKDAVIASAPFGWTTDAGKINGFTFGGRTWLNDGTDKAAANPDPVIQRQYTPTGDMTPWLEAAKMVTDQKRPSTQAILATAFAAPLMRFTGQLGSLMAAYSSDSGIGKSTTMQVAQAVWGHPVTGMQSMADTSNSVVHKIGQLKSLPVMWDELKGEADTQKFINFMFQLGQGKERSRLTADIQQKDPGTWESMVTVASNDSLRDYVLARTKTTPAGLYRLFEFEVTRGVIGQIDAGDAARMTQKLRENFGHAGLVYAKFLGQKHTAAERLVAAKQTELAKRLSAVTDERFWFATMACLVVGAHLANHLHLTEFDIPALEQFLTDTLVNLRGIKASIAVDLKQGGDVAEILQQYLTAMQGRHTLQTDKMHISGTRPPKGSIKILSDVTRLDGVNVHIGADAQAMRLRKKHLRDWLTEHGYSSHLIISSIETELGATTTKACMAAGTQHSDLMQDTLLHIDMKDPKVVAALGGGV